MKKKIQYWYIDILEYPASSRNSNLMIKSSSRRIEKENINSVLLGVLPNGLMRMRGQRLPRSLAEEMEASGHGSSTANYRSNMDRLESPVCLKTSNRLFKSIHSSHDESRTIRVLKHLLHLRIRSFQYRVLYTYFW